MTSTSKMEGFAPHNPRQVGSPHHPDAVTKCILP